LLYRVCSFFLADRRQRRLAFLVASLTSGFGCVLVILKYALHQSDVVFPMDLYIAEGNTFLGILGYPHFIAAALYIFVFDLLLRGHRKASYLYSLAAGLAALFLGWQHAYDLVSVYGVMGAYTVLLALRDRKIPVFWVLSIAIVGSISWWPALYSVWLTSADPVWKQILGQFVNAGVFTPGPLHLLILFGPAFLIALATVVRMNPVRLRKLDNASLFLVAWFLVTFVLIYLPVNYQIHLLNGWQVPIAILAVRGLYTYGRPLAARTARLFTCGRVSSLAAWPGKRCQSSWSRRFYRQICTCLPGASWTYPGMTTPIIFRMMKWPAYIGWKGRARRMTSSSAR
jgi:hypothetical protein